MRYTVNANKHFAATTEIMYRSNVAMNAVSAAHSFHLMHPDYRDIWVTDETANRVVWHNGNLIS